MTATIRPATPADAAAVFAIWDALRRHNAAVDARIVPTPVAEAEFTAGFAEVLKREEACVFVADDGGRVVGFVRGGLEMNQPDRLPERHATVGYLYVDPASRRAGLGRGLYDAVAEWAARQDGIAHMEMSALANDESAAAFWRSLGFSPFINRLWRPLNGDTE